MAVARGRFWVIDIEGNGARPPEIVEIAVVEIERLALTGRRMHWLLRPQTPIAPMATRVHGIRDRDVADAPTIEDVADDLMTWLEGAAIVGHNVRVDLEAISRPLPGWSPTMAVDTLALARALRPGLASYALAKLGESLELAERASALCGGRPHSAPYDALVTALLFIDLVGSVDDADRAGAIEKADVVATRRGTLL